MPSEVTLALWQLAVLLVGVALATAAALRALRKQPPTTAAVPTGVPQSVPPAAPQAAASVPRQETQDTAVAAPALAEGMFGAYDLASGSPAVRSHIRQALRGVGVLPLEVAEGTPFDPAMHLVVDTEPAGPERSGRVARQVRPGWISSNNVMRPAEVIVWTA